MEVSLEECMFFLFTIYIDINPMRIKIMMKIMMTSKL